jgi:hypothetical protein
MDPFRWNGFQFLQECRLPESRLSDQYEVVGD